MRLRFREMVPEDAGAVAEVEKESFPTPWSRESFWREAANENTCYLLALDGEKVIGYAGCWISFGEAQITNIEGKLPVTKSITTCRTRAATMKYVSVVTEGLR